MRDERGQGRGRKGGSSVKTPGPEAAASAGRFNDLLEEIEHLLFQSTQGHHFMFDNADIVRVLSTTPPDDFSLENNMVKVNSLFSGLLDCRTLPEKRSFLDRISPEEFDLLVRAYFHLVEKTMLANYEPRH